MEYTIKSHPTPYKGVLFRSRLEARWAAFFDLAEWTWEYEPFDLKGWTPDFRVEFGCGHSECPPTHILLVEIKPYTRIEEFKGHPCLDYPYGCLDYNPNIRIPADASAAFGNNPNVTYWEMGHGAGGGECTCLQDWVRWDCDDLWKRAGNMVQWKPTEKR